MIHKNLLLTHYLIVNISGLDGDSLTIGVLDYTTCSEATSTVVASVNGVDGNGGRGGWQTGASIMDGFNGRGGAYGWNTGVTHEICTPRYLALSVIKCHISVAYTLTPWNNLCHNP